MKIKVDLKIFLIMLLFLITNQFRIYWLFMAFILIHELAHLLAGVLLGLKPRKIRNYAITVCQSLSKQIIKRDFVIY